MEVIIDIIEWRDALLESDVGRNAKFMGLVLSQFYRRKNLTYPSIKTLATYASASVNTVQPGIKELEKKGFIKRDKRRLKGMSFTTNIYTFIGVTEILHPKIDTSIDTSNDTSNDTSISDNEVEEVDKKKEDDFLKYKNIKFLLEKTNMGVTLSDRKFVQDHDKKQGAK